MNPSMLSRFLTFALCSLLGTSLLAQDKQIILLAGKPSHGPGDHEFNAGCLLLQKCLANVPGVQVQVHSMGWPKDESVLEHADAILIYADGGQGHPAIQQERMQTLDRLAAKGVGIGCAHYGVEVPVGDPGKALKEWIGGHYEHQFSVNPMWEPDFTTFPSHPVTRGLKPFKVLDEWYFNMRFREDMAGVTPILSATPSEKVRQGPYVWPKGPYPHIVAQQGRSEVMMWVRERPDGGRGFGFTGGHRHVNWGNPSFRKVVLNALLWIAGVEVPPEGVVSFVTPEDLKQNLDPK
jgi:type 1 glutamine amidotransferase